MNILLTGKPRAGKTTLIENFISKIDNKQGFISREVRNGGGRTGFELISSSGRTATLASVDSTSNIRVGRYGVNLDKLDIMLNDISHVTPGYLLYIDEIGHMELLLDRFKSIAWEYLNSYNMLIGTISSKYQDDFTKKVFNREDVAIIKVTQENRDELNYILSDVAKNYRLYERLGSKQIVKFCHMAYDYGESNKITQLGKLFNNAIRYITDNRIHQKSKRDYLVQGDHTVHTVTIEENNYACDCDLYNGAGKYKGSPGECSHIQAVKLSDKGGV